MTVDAARQPTVHGRHLHTDRVAEENPLFERPHQGETPKGWHMATVSRLAVVVAQHGADVSACVGQHADGLELLQQEPGETPTQLTSRVRGRLSALAGAGFRIDTARFIARSGFEARDVMAAAGLVRGLVSAMVAAGTAQVHLHAQPNDTQTRYALTALAEAMTEELQGTGVDFIAHFSPCASPAAAKAQDPMTQTQLPR